MPAPKKSAVAGKSAKVAVSRHSTTSSAPRLELTVEVGAAAKALAPAVKRLEKALKKLDPKGLPIGALSDMLYDLRALGKLPQSLATPFDDLLAPVIKQVEEHFIQTLAVGESSGVQGKRSRTQISEAIIPVVKNWPLFYKHIKKTGEFELMNRAVNRAAVSERWDLKKRVPGVEPFHAKRVSCTKLSGK